MIAGLEDHCGYEFSWSPYNLLSCDSGYHAYHHLYNLGNYASYFKIWDSMMGTNKAYYEFLKDLDKSKASWEELSASFTNSDQLISWSV